MEKTGKNKPELIAIGGAKLVNYFCVNIDPIYNEDNETWSWSSINLTPGTLDYSEIVSGLVGLRYSSDKVEAIVNNYLSFPSDIDAKFNFEALQAWRDESKKIAREAIKEAIDKKLWVENEGEQEQAKAE